jgi:beta-lactamase regulating signal transducer with metallopeptidase domain
MGIGVSLILIAVGAVLAFAVHVSTSGFNVNTIGYILLVVGIIGIILSMVFWSSWAGPGYFSRDGGSGRRRRIIEEDVA